MELESNTNNGEVEQSADQKQEEELIRLLNAIDDNNTNMEIMARLFTSEALRIGGVYLDAIMSDASNPKTPERLRSIGKSGLNGLVGAEAKGVPVQACAQYFSSIQTAGIILGVQRAASSETE